MGLKPDVAPLQGAEEKRRASFESRRFSPGCDVRRLRRRGALPGTLPEGQQHHSPGRMPGRHGRNKKSTVAQRATTSRPGQNAWLMFDALGVAEGRRRYSVGPVPVSVVGVTTMAVSDSPWTSPVLPSDSTQVPVMMRLSNLPYPPKAAGAS